MWNLTNLHSFLAHYVILLAFINAFCTNVNVMLFYSCFASVSFYSELWKTKSNRFTRQAIYVLKIRNQSQTNLEPKPILFTENEESPFNDPDCDAAVSYSAWGPCLPKCKNSDDEMGIRKRKLKYNSRKSFKECGVSLICESYTYLSIFYNDIEEWMFLVVFVVVVGVYFSCE